ncbi:hypothetical protein F4703DRAFT_1790094 [Phycomyces blakesleeanus]
MTMFCSSFSKIHPKDYQNTTLCIYLILCFMVVDCLAAPVVVENILSPTEIAAITMMRTFFLSYLAHAKTVRPDSTTIRAATFYKRVSALAFPTSGIYDAVGSMIRVFYGDKILGIESFNRFLKKKMVSRNVFDYRHQPYVCSEISIDTPTLKKDFQYNSHEEHSNTTPYISYLAKDPSKQWVDQYRETLAEFNSKKNDNAPFLAALLHSIGPLRARKVRHCILNGGVFIGYNEYNGTNCMRRYRLTSKDMILAGSGAMCRYQVPVCSSAVRYLPVDMINELQAASFIDSTSYFQVMITLFQLGYTLYECIRGIGNRWSKIVMIVFTIMSVFQTMSLMVLHTQVAAFSIRCKNEEKFPECPLIHGSRCKAGKAKNCSKDAPPDTPTDTSTDLLKSTSFAHKFTFISSLMERNWVFCPSEDTDLNRVRRNAAHDVMSKSGVSPAMINELFGDEKADLVDISSHPGGWWEIVSFMLGSASPFLLGIWAGYGASATVMSPTIGWISISFGYSYTFIRTFYPTYFINFRFKDLQTSLVVISYALMSSFGIAYIIQITIKGYLFSDDDG